jgi:CSLREA domain-containing protein
VKQLSPYPISGNVRPFLACLLSFAILVMPFAAMAAPRSGFNPTASEGSSANPAREAQPKVKSAADDVFVKPLTGTSSALPGPQPEPAPQPPAPPVGSVTSSLTASLLAGNGGVDADSDGKADPGDTIAYTLTLTNSSGAGATGLAIANPLDSHTTIVGGSLNSTPVAFDQSVSLNEDATLLITLSGQDPDGSNLIFKDSVGAAFPSNPTTIATAHGTIGTFGSVTCDANGVCSQQVTYTPAPNYNGPDTFSFKANDSTANSNENGVVSITVNPVNDAPTFTVPGNPTAVNEDAGLQTVSNYITGVRPAQSGNATEDSQTVSFVVTNVTHSALFTAGGQPVLNVSNGGNQPFPLTANLVYTPAPNANGTSVITYHLHDNGGTANSGVDNSADQTFTITVNAVNDAPVAVAKAFTVQANMKITGLSGLLTGVTDPDATNGAADSLSFDAAAPAYTTPNVTLTSVTLGTCTNGTISNINTAGSFDFDPPPGITASCVLKYQVTDTGKGSGGNQTSAQADITITFNGPVIWFVDPTRATDGNGTLSNTSAAVGAFNKLSSANAKLATLGTNQKVFIYTGTTASGAGEVLDLAANTDWLVGQGTVAASFDAFFGLTGGSAPPAGTIARPTLNSTPSTANAARPTVSGTVTMRNNTQVTGVNIVTTGANRGLTSAGFTAGTSLIKDVSVTSATGNGVDLSSGTQTVTYETSDGTNSPNVLVSVGGIALNVAGGVTIGANGFNFKSISANGGSKGIVLNTTGTAAGNGGLTVTGTGTTAGSGGTIQNTTSNGIDIKTAKNISLKNMTINANGTSQTVSGPSSSCGGDLAVGNNLSCVANIFMQSVTTASFDRFTVTNSGQQGINGNAVNGLSITNSTITGNGNEGFENGILLQNQSGTTTITDNTIQDNRARQIHIGNTSGTMTLTLGGTSSNSLVGRTVVPGNGDAQQGVLLQLQGTSNSTVNASKLTINNSLFNNGGNVYTNAFQINADNGGPTVNGSITSSSFDRYASGVFVNAGGTANVTFDVMNNLTMTHGNLDAINYTILGGGAGVTAKITGTISDNTINGCEPANTNCHGIDLNTGTNQNGELHLKIDHNNVQQTGAGITLLADGATVASTGKVHLKITRNTISNPGFATGRAAIELQATLSSPAGANMSICTDVGGAGLQNIISGAWSTGSSQSGIFLRHRFSAPSSWVLPGYAGPANNSGAQVEAYLNGRNTNTATPFQSTASTNNSGYANGAACTTPLLVAEGGVEALLNPVSLPSSLGEASLYSFSFGARARTFDDREAANLMTAPVGVASSSLSQQQLDSMVSAAIARWSNTGLTAPQISILRAIKFDVADLSNAYLGEADGSHVLIDRNGGGKGWYIGANPTDDSIFGRTVSSTRRYTDPMSAPAGHVDLLTAIMHEMGHKLGLGDSYSQKDRENLMYGYLTVGERRLPSNGQAPVAAGASSQSHFLALEPSSIAIAFGEVLAGAVGADAEVFDKAEALVDAEAFVGGESEAANKVASQISQSVLNVARATSGMSGLRTHADRNMAVSVNAAARGLSATTSMLPPTPIGSFPINGTGAGQGFQLPIGKSITITFKATLNAPPNFASYSATQKVSAQAVLTGNFTGTPLSSDDPSVNVVPADPTATDVDHYDSTTSISVSPSNSTNTSQPVTFTATIGTSGTPNGSAFNRTGTVNFRDNGATIGCDSQGVSHVGSNDVATCTTSSLTTGVHNNITAAYSGDGNFDPSTSSAFTQTVSKSGTNATLVSSLNPATVTQNITFTFTISSATSVPGPPTGTVTFKDGASTIGCSNAGGQLLNGSGVATCQISTLTATSHTITADYPGDTNFNANNAIALTASGGQNGNPQVVNKATPSVTLVSSLNPAFVGQTVTFTGTVSAPGGISGTPSGALIFKDGAGTITCSNGGGQNLNGSGVGTCQVSNLSAGNHTITVNYGGDSSFNIVNGTALTASGGQNGNPQVINQANTTMTVASSLNPSKVSESVKFTVNIISSNLGAVPGPPTGQVKFWDGPANTGTQIGVTKTLGTGGSCNANSACVDSDTTTSLIAGTHTITVEYLGDSSFTANSANLSGGQVVNKSNTTTTITSDAPDSSNVGQQVDIVAHITSPPPGVTFTNTGTVQFKDGANTISGCGAQTINGSGDATCSTTALPAGARSLTAVYSGDATFNTSTSAVEPHQVGPVCPNSVVVTSAGDNGAGTLRQAIADVCSGGTITFDATTFPAPGPNFINLIDAGGVGVGGELLIDKNVTINGPAASILTVRRDLSATTNFRVFEISSGKTVTITGMTISNGNATGLSPASGGGVYNDHGTLTLTNCVVSGNTADTGGGINANGVTLGSAGLTLTATTVNGNIANTFGGGVYIGATAPGSATVVIDKTTFSGNNAGLTTNGSGGGLDSNGADTLTIKNSTFSGNTAGASGGGILVDGGPTTLTGVTITANVADNNNDNTGTGGGIDVETGTFTLQDTIVAGNFKGVGSGQMQQETGTVAGSITSGTQQIDILTVTGGPVTTCSPSGNIKLTVTAVGMTGSGTPVLVPVNENDTAAQVTDAIVAFLSGGGAPNITSFFTVTKTGATELTFTRKAAADNDPAMSITLTDDSCMAITSSSDSTTTPGASSGNAKVVVTSTGMAGSPLTISVPVAKPDNQDDVASKMRAALAANSTINARFTVSGSTNQIILTRLVSVPNDPNLNIETNNDGCTGLTPQLISSDGPVGAAAASPNDLSGTVDAASSYNLVGDALTAGGLIDVSGDAVHQNQVGNGGTGTVTTSSVLDVNLADNGGATRTHKLVASSPAIDKGKSFSLTTDQRGFLRPVDDGTITNATGGDGADIGAFEVQGPTPVPTLSLTSTIVSGITTRDTTPDFQAGNLITGATVKLLRDDDGAGGNPPAVVLTTTASGATMSLTDSTLLTDGSFIYSVSQTVGSDTQTSSDVPVIVDTRPTTPDLLTADDTFGPNGTNTDDITKVTTPTFTGTADKNTTVRLFADGNLVGNTISDNGTGAWSITSSALSATTHSITAKEVIGSFVGAPSTALSVTIDTSVAAPTGLALLTADNSGSTADTITNVNTPRITGAAEAGSKVTLFSGATQIGIGDADNAGNFTITISPALADNTYQVTAQATDIAGNVSALSSPLANLVIDTQIPAPPSQPDLITADDTGAFNNDNVTKKTTPTFTGTAEADSTVKLYQNTGGPDVEIGSTTATGGVWSITSSALAANTYSISAKSTDTAGNTSNASTILTVTIDDQVPNAPSTPDLIATDDTGASNSDDITKKTTPTFSGTAEANSKVELFKDADPTPIGTGNADGSGNWSIASGALADGTYQITAKATDLAGNQSVASSNLQVVIDTQPPIAPSTPALNPADDTGTLNSDGITKKNNPNFTGTAEAGSTVQLFAGAAPVGFSVATGGNWSITSSVLGDNSYNVTAQATDLAGNTSSPSGPFALVIDTVKPTVTMSSVIGNPTATTPIPVTVQFSETVFGFTSGDIVPSNGTVGNFAGSNANYSFDLTPTAPGGVSADIAADGATDTAGNGNTAAVQFNRTYDPSALNATITAISPNPRNTAVSSIQIVFNKPVTGFDLGDLTLKLNNGANLLPGAQTLTSADNATWTLGNLAGITGAQGTYDLKLTAAGSNIKDSTNTALASDATASWVMDTTAPTVTVEQAIGQTDPVTGPTGTTIINFTATFTESVTGFTSAGVTIFGTANPTIVNVTGSGTTYNLAVQGMSQTGTVRASVNAGAAADSAGNGNAASTSADNTVQFNADNFSTLEINTTADTDDGRCDALGTGSGNQDCTLREAINAANADFGAETITFNSTVFAAPGPYTINLGSALPNLSSDVTITGPGAKVLTVARNTGGNYRIFTIASGNNNVTIDGLTINNGNAAGGGSFDRGGGIFISSTGAVQVTNCTISGNTATADGGGIVSAGSAGTLDISGTTISGNSAGTPGGGISIVGLAPVTITNSTISGNSAKTDGGGIFTQAAAVTISSSTITNNHADSDNNSTGTGGGLFRSSGAVTLRNTIIGGNFDGGGVKQAETATVVGTITSAGTKNAAVTVTAAGMTNSPKTLNVAVVNGDNASAVAGKIRVALAADANVSAFFTVSGATNQIILTTITAAANDGTMNIATDNGTSTGLTPAPTSADTTPGGGDVVGTVQSDGFNLLQSTAGATINQNGGAGPNIIGVDPLLTPLADNGGPTKTHAPQCVSKAIDNGKNFTLTTDQRGGTRPFDLADSVYPNAVGGDGSDIGAFETQSGGGCVPLAIGPSPQPSTPEDPPSALTITLTGTYSQNTPLSFIITQQPGNGATLTPSAPVCNFNLSTTCTSSVSYTPSLNFNGVDLFKFKVSASGLDSDEVDVDVTVTPVNDPPVANNDILLDVAEDSGTLAIPFATLLGNDTPGPANEAGQNITINSVSNAVNGTVSIQGTNVLFTPNLNFYGAASFKYTILDDGTTNGVSDPRGSGLATVNINVTPVPDTPSVTPATTNEDVQTTSGLVITRNAVDGAEITNFKITGITNGTLFLNNGTTPIHNGDFITVAQGAPGLKFTPAADLFSPTTTFSFQIQASLNGTDTGLGGGLATAAITVNAVADTPSVTPATTTVNTQTSSGLVITRNAADSTEVTNFKITNILNGTLFKNNGTTQINNNDFITFAEGNAGLKFTPANNLSSPATTFSFNAQASTSNADAGLGGSTALATITVGCGATVVSSSGDGAPGSLRSIINSACPGSTITFDMTPGHVVSPMNMTIGELLIDKNLTIQGPGANLLTVQRTLSAGAPFFRVFNSKAGQTSTISGLTINNGNISGDGAGVLNGGTLTLSNVTVSGSTSTASGGGVANSGTLTVIGSTISGNTSPAGSGIFTSGGTLTVTNSTLSGNSSDGVSNLSGTISITNSTFSGNTIRGITNNSGTVNIGNTIVANTPGGGADVVGAFTSQGHNLIGNKGASTGFTNGLNGDIVGSSGSVIDPRLGPLANNGGPTLTHALLAGSLALDGGDNALVANPPFSGAAPFNDQRGAGFLRIRDAADVNTTQTVDIGAFEADPSIEDITDKSTPENAQLSFNFNVGDGATAFDSITATSSNTTLVPNGNIVISGSGSSRTMALTPAANQTGTSTITVTVTKTLGGAPRSMSDTFVLTVNDGGTLQFSSGTYTVLEGGGSAGITITRAGGSAGTATIQIATSNGTGVAGTDYTAVSQTVTFNDGETSKIVNVPITDNLNNQPNRTVNLTLSNVGGSGQPGSPLTAVLTILDDDPIGGYIKFSAPTYSVGEGAGQAIITVQRVGTLSQAVTVDYATSDDSDPAAMVSCAPTPGNTIASSRCDFNTAVGRLSFAAGDGSPKTFTVMINQDTYLEGPENLPLTLSNLTGGASFASPSTATLTITDDDLVAPTSNTIDDPASFVKQHYHDFLNREPDPSGLAFWTNEITSCGGNAACIEIKRINVSAAFFLSIEFQVTGGTAYLINKVSFGGLPKYLRFETDAQAIGRNYVFGQPGAEGILEANKVAFYNEYVSRTEFTNTYNGATNPEYVNTLISNTGVFFTQVERDALLNGLNNQTETRATVLRKISEKPAFRQAEFNSMFVLMEYFGYLRRNPDTPGFNFWLNKLNQFNGNFIQADMVKAFLVSAEYRQRFGP